MTAHVYGNSHIKALTGLRGVGALLVVFYHFHQAETGILQPLFEFFGSVGVMVFFALSGYILTSIYDKRFYSGVSAFSYFDFLCKRIARIYPLHFFLLIIMLLVYPRFVYAPDSGLRQVFTNLTLTQAWSFDRFSFIAASWSISVEFLFYILFPFFVFFMRRNISLFVFWVWVWFMVSKITTGFSLIHLNSPMKLFIF